jgi:hypothetical protein
LREPIFENASRREIRVNEGQRLWNCDNPPVAATTSIFENDDVARPRVFNLVASVKNKAEIAFLVSMKMPVRRVGTRIERFTKARIDEDADDQHATIDACSSHIRCVMVRRANPSMCFGDDRGAFLVFIHSDVIRKIMVRAPRWAVE